MSRVDARSEFLEDRRRILEAVSAASRVPPGSSEWNRGVLSLPECPRALRTEYAGIVGGIPYGAEMKYLESPYALTCPDPFETALFRRWALLTAMPDGQSACLRDPQYVPPWAEGNGEALATAREATSVSIENGSPTRPSGEWVFDLVSRDDGWSVLDEAHALSHWKAETMLLEGEGRGVLEDSGSARGMAESVAESGLSRLAGVDFSSLREAGLAVSASEGLQSSDGWIPVKFLPAGATAVVFCSYRVEPPPKTAESGEGGWLEVNRWCCAPTTVAFLGFACMDVVLKCPVVRRGRAAFVHVPPGAMHPMRMLGGYLECARDRGIRMPEPGGVVDTPHRTPWPCRMCMALPRSWARDREGAMGIDGIFRDVDRASEWYERKATGRTMADVRKSRSARRKAWKAMSSRAMKVARETARARRWLEKGDPGKAAEIMKRVRQGQ